MVEKRGKLENYKIASVDSVSHLLFVDDMLYFTKANVKSLLAIKEVILDFSSFTLLYVKL